MFHSMFPLISFYHYTSRHLLTFRFIFWSCTCHSSFSLLLILPSFHSPFFVLPTSSSLSLRSLFRAVRRPRRAADNLWAPPPTFAHRRAAVENLSERRRWHFCCVLLFMQFRIDD